MAPTQQKSGKNEPTPPQRGKKALVLPGGGGRGAYQLGVAKALFERGLRFDFLFGTSIGGINATFLGQGQLERLIEVWSYLRPRDIFGLPPPAQLAGMIFGTKLGMLDPSPLEDLIRKEIDFAKLKASSSKIGLFTTDLCSLETRLFTIDDIKTREELINLLMASSAIPIAFPPRQLGGHGLWIDGGLVKNTPMQAAIDLGADEVYVVLLHPESINTCPTSLFGVLTRCLDIILDASANREIQTIRLANQLARSLSPHSCDTRDVKVHIFQPRKPVNINLLEISPSVSRLLIKQGYEEAVTQLNELGIY